MTKVSFAGLYDFADHLANAYQEAERISDVDCKTDDTFTYINLMSDYYECLKKSPRLKDQTAYIKGLIYKVNPAYAKGYFESKKKR